MNSVGWFEIYVDDMKRATSFYESVLGKKLDQMETPDSVGDIEMNAFPGEMKNYGSNGALVRMKGFPAGNNSVIVYFACEDCSVEESRVVANGGKIEKKKSSIGDYGFMSLVRDTEGNTIGLHSMK